MIKPTVLNTRHFIITLFNLPLWDRDKRGRVTRTAQWLADRCDRFERWCLPSVAGQTRRDFTWLVLFDADTPAPVRERVERWRWVCPQFTPLWFTAQECATLRSPDPARRCDFIRQTVRSRLDGTEEFVVTTNLDNDDALHLGAVAAIRRAAAAGALVSLNDGLQYFEGMGAAVRMRYPHNHFLSLVEDARGDFKTVIYHNHARARKTLPVVDVKGAPMWMEVVHGANVSNGLRLTSRIRYGALWGRVDLRPFGVDVVAPARRQAAAMLLRLPLLAVPTLLGKLARKLGKKKEDAAQNHARSV